MSKIFKLYDPVMILADYKNPELYKHLASHIIISLGGKMVWNIENEEIRCRGICINSNILHTGVMSKEGSIVFLFDETGRYAASIKKKYLNNRPYAILDDNVVDRMLDKYTEEHADKEVLDEACMLAGVDSPSHCAATCKRMYGISLRDMYKQ